MLRIDCVVLEGNSQWGINGDLVQRVSNRGGKKILDGGYVWKVEPIWLPVGIHLDLISHSIPFSLQPTYNIYPLRFPQQTIWNSPLMSIVSILSCFLFPCGFMYLKLHYVCICFPVSCLYLQIKCSFHRTQTVLFPHYNTRALAHSWHPNIC